MKPACLVSFLFGPFLLAASAYACQVVDGEHIRGGDLAAVVPAFRTLDPTVEIGLAPLPGIKRVLHPGDLLQLARDHGIDLPSAPAEACFERHRLDPAQAARTISPLPAAVKRGDKVAVSVIAGSVLLRFESEAESSGRVGDTVIELNPSSGNRFVARVQDQGRVRVEK
jgi:hypothetical protein